MGQIANQMLIDAILKWKAKLKLKKEEKKKKQQA